MSWAALTSGGKDSILACQKALESGRDVKHLVTVRPKNPDSYMFHSVNIDAVPVIAEVAGMEYVEIASAGEKETELVDLATGLAALDIEGVVAGAVASSYQYERVKAIADRLGISVFAPLWQMDTRMLMDEVASRLDAIIVVTAADGLDESFLGMHIDKELIERLVAVAARRHINIAGEGGEYESLTLNAPFYSRPIKYETAFVRWGPDRRELICGGFS